ncbi:MAG TPA: serine/threonine-protein kinase, partial [Gemmatimonadales bacterium]|nr:serine/threonine-protein kinase [Gemmatimonadales bacterium]
MSSLLERARAALAPAYRVEGSLGVGGMGEVFRATDTALQRAVAIKVLRPEVATQVAVERFLREGRVLARLSHPNIVPVHHAGVADGIYFLVMELQDCETLSDRLERGALSPREAQAVVRGMLDGLQHSHAHGVFHRDVKPSNVFLARTGARLGDFGIAHDESDPSLTHTGTSPGTVAYMAPEQRAGLPATLRTDLHAVGAVLYECLTGRRWVESQGEWARVPPALVPVIRRALEHDPAARWPDARSFAAAIDAAMVAPASRRAWLTALSIGLIPVAAVVLTYLFRGCFGDPPPPPPPEGT